MSEWTNQELEWTYEYSKKVYEQQLSKSDAQDWLKQQMPSRSRDSFGMYIDDFFFMMRGDPIKRSASRAMFEYYIKRISTEYTDRLKNAFSAVCGYIKYDFEATGNKNKPLKESIEKLAEQMRVDIGNFEPYKSDIKDKSEWWPSLEMFSPEITKKKWKELFADTDIFTDNTFFMLAAMYDFGGFATCVQLVEKYGKTSEFYRNVGIQLASKVKKKLSIPNIEGDDENSKVWPVVFQGRDAKKSENGTYVWKIRPELFDALTEFDILRFLQQKEGEEEVSTKETLSEIEQYIASKGFSYDKGLIENFYLSLKSKPFVILAGTSGTGKTRLVKLFAEAVGATSKESGGNGHYKLVSVRPDWSDSSDLFGHVNLKGEFVPGAIIDFIKDASEHKDYPYFLCLDEMNLARVEYYLSDFLSIIETRRNVSGEILTDEINLDKAAEKNYKNLMLPENLFVVGTVNMDETTFPFSKKVLDRANTIEFSYVDLEPDFDEQTDTVYPVPQSNEFLKSEYIVLKSDIKESQKNLVTKICTELQAINEILQSANAHVGYRVRDEIVFYMLNNDSAKLLDYEDALDNEIMQKILPRIQGSSVAIKELLSALFKKFAGDYTGLSQDLVWKQMQTFIDNKKCVYKHSAEKICYMMRRYEEDGFTSYWL